MNKLISVLFCTQMAVSASSQTTIEWRNNEVVTDSNHNVVYYQKSDNEPLNGSIRIMKGLDEEIVNLKDGIMDGSYLRLRDGIVREEGNYTDDKISEDMDLLMKGKQKQRSNAR